MRTKLLLFLLLLLSSAVHSQENTGTIRGTVIENATQVTLPGATIVLLDIENKGTITDANGKFRIEGLPYGRYAIQVSFIGYQAVTLNNLDVLPGKETVLTIELEESLISLEEVQVVADNDKTQSLNPLSTVSSQTFSVDETMRFAGARNDVARMATNYAGVAASNDANNDIVIRGNSPNGLIFRLEGADIPNPNHFGQSGATGGPVSMLNNNTLANSEFFTGAFPANYGNALSGVFDLNMRNGNNENFEFLGQIGFNGVELGAEGPINKKSGASFLVNYRYSTLAFFKLAGIEFGTGTAVPEYQDLNFKLNFPTKKAGTFGVFGVLGDSFIEFKNSEDSASTDFYSQQQQDIRSGTRNATIGLNHKVLLGKNTVLRSTVWWSYIENKNDVDTFDLDIREPFDFYDGIIKNQYFGANIYVNHKLGPKNFFQLGMEAIFNDYDFNDSVYYASDALYRPVTNTSGNTSLLQPYFTWQFKPGVRWKINAGVHTSFLLLNNNYSIEPRAGVTYQIDESNFINFGYGIHSQSAPLNALFSETYLSDGTKVQPNTGLDFTKSNHFVLGYQLRFSPVLHFKTEVYYQQIYDAVTDANPGSYSALNIGSFFAVAPDSLANDGTGRNTGIEFTFEQFMNKGSYYLFTVSLFDSKYTGSDGIERNTAFNGNYIINALGGKEFELNRKTPKADRKKIMYIVLDSKVTFAGGNRYTPIDLEASQAAGEVVYDNSQAYSLQLDPYFRWDLRLGLKMLGRKTTQEWTFDIQNLTNRKNPHSVSYNPETGEEILVTQLGLFPVFQYRIYF